jgi:hypothetical protein
MDTAYDGRQIVGMDLHRRRSVLVRMTEDGRRLGMARITNSPQELQAQIARAGTSPKVVLEATFGWCWAADTLAGAGAEVHLAHPLGVKAFTYRRVKNDERDAADLADLLRMGRLPEAWIAPAEVRELRELTRYRHKLVHLRTSCKDQVHGVLAKLGIPVTCTDIFGTAGSAWLDGLGLPQPYAGKVTSLRHLTGELTGEITMLSAVIADLLAQHRGYQVIQQLPGVGPVLAAVIIAEIGDVTRFKTAAQLSGQLLLPVSAQVREGAAIAAGDEVDADIELDTEPREVNVPADLAAALDHEPDARQAFDGMLYSHRLRYVTVIEDAKTPETRQRRIAKTVSSLRSG